MCLAQTAHAAEAEDRVTGGATPTFSASITYKGHPSWVYVFPSGDKRLALVVTAAACTIEGEISF
jgi:hypothetical protein